VKKTSLVAPTAVAALLSAAVFAASTSAQAPQAPPPGGAMMARMPAPTNLQVLPKDLTMRQVHEIMEHWAGDLGVHCDTCHAADPNNVGPNGRPRLNFASDAKEEKAMARIMYTMTEDLKKNYVAKVAAMDKMDQPAAPVTCGTCHRGHIDPEPFAPAPEHPQSAPPAAPGGLSGTPQPN
jgi:hypothetical protein